ncbi:hypothetical protein KFL_005960010, partial [Klebsormidium nitens]
MAVAVPLLCARMLVLTILCGCVMGGVHAATIEQFGNLVEGPLWNQTLINLSGKNLCGPIPPELGNLVNLVHLNLSSNAFNGSIPPHLSNLTNLAYLDLTYNNLAGPVPTELRTLTNLTYLSLSFNRLRSRPIPLELGSLTNLTGLYLGSNNFFGPIPSQLGNLTKVQYLDLASNRLSGPITQELCKLTNLTYLSLFNNRLSGGIPPDLRSLSQLTNLHLDSNQLSGPIPANLGSLTNLSDLYLHSNRLSGPVPPELGNLSNLTNLLLCGNNLSGPIPPSLGNLSKLVTLYLFSNNLTDTVCREVNLSLVENLTRLGLPCSPPPSLKHTNLTYLAQPVGSQSTKSLDLSLVPSSCKLVNLTGSHPHLESINFWGACSTGCVVSLAGTEASLSRSTKRKVCLSRISIFIGGDIPYQLYDQKFRFNNTLKNEQGLYYLADPDFVDTIDLGPEGRAYTGVGFSRVQSGNLCSNPEAKAVAAALFGAFTVALLLATFSIVVIARWRRRIRGSSVQERRSH